MYETKVLECHSRCSKNVHHSLGWEVITLFRCEKLQNRAPADPLFFLSEIRNNFWLCPNCSTGKSQVKYASNSLYDRNLIDKFQIMCYDTAASNSDHLNEACVLFNQELEKGVVTLSLESSYLRNGSQKSLRLKQKSTMSLAYSAVQKV